MRNRSWVSVLLLVLVVAIASFALGLYFGPIVRQRPAVAQGPTRFFTNFDPQQHLASTTKLDWNVLTDEPVTGEHYGNFPHSRAYARRKVRLTATVTEEQWVKLKSDLNDVFMRQGELVEEHGEDPGGGHFAFWRIDPNAEDNDTAPRHGFGYRYYGGPRGVGSHHGLFTFSVVKADDRLEIVFFIWESWPRNE